MLVILDVRNDGEQVNLVKISNANSNPSADPNTGRNDAVRRHAVAGRVVHRETRADDVRKVQLVYNFDTDD